MYSREDRIKAVELWLKYGKRTKTVIRELGVFGKKKIQHWGCGHIVGLFMRLNSAVGDMPRGLNNLNSF